MRVLQFFSVKIQSQLLQAIGIVRQTAAWLRSVALVLLGAMGDSDGECQAVRPDNICIDYIYLLA